MPRRTRESAARHLRTSVGHLVRSTRSVDEMSPVAAGVMDLLRRHGALTTADLAAIRHVRHQSMSATISELIDAGYVTTHPHPADGRKKLASLTKAGQDALAADAERREALLADAMSVALSTRELDDLIRGLDAIDRVTAALTEATGVAEGQFVSSAW